MAQKEIRIDQILLKRGNTTQWTNTSYVLKNGEPGWDTEKKILKIGNGTDSWADLSVVGAEGDDITIVKDGNTLSLKGFTEAEEGAQLRKKADGSLEWFVPSTETVDGLQSAVSGLQSDVSTLQSDLDNAEIAIVANTDSISAINTKIGTVPEGKDVVTMISDAQTAATYDDTELSGRVKTIEDDYLKSSDRTNLENSIKTNTDAIETLNGDETKEGSVKKTVVDEIAKVVANAPEDFDTLKEIADWIANDQTGAAALTNRIANIENTYLTEEEINDLIAELELYIGTIPEGAQSTNVIAYIQEVVDALKIADYAKAVDLTNLTTRVKAIEDDYLKASDKEALEGSIGEVNTNLGAHTDNTDIHVTADEKAVWNGLPAALAQKVSMVEVAGTELVPDENGMVSIPFGDLHQGGVVKSSAAEGKVSIDGDGIMTVNSLNVNNLVQTDGDILILDGGIIA